MEGGDSRIDSMSRLLSFLRRICVVVVVVVVVSAMAFLFCCITCCYE